MSKKAIPANVGYHGYQHTLCTSINHVVCHGIPDDSRILKEGDIVNIDVTVIKDGYHGDTSKMWIIGEGSIMAQRICKIAQDALYAGMKAVRNGAYVGDIGATIQAVAEPERFSVVKNIADMGLVTYTMMNHKFCTMVKKYRSTTDDRHDIYH